MDKILVERSSEIPNDFTGIAEFKRGGYTYFLNGTIHREDGPAVIGPNNSYFMWIINNEKHRTDGPAYECFASDGRVITRHWYINNYAHRTDGPAVESNSYVEWWLDGIQLKIEDFFNLISAEDKEKIVWNLELWSQIT